MTASRRWMGRTTLDRSRRRSTRAVSDVVGTILLLALTVTLFSSIFFFVSTFPTPPPQPANQFSAYLTYNSGATKINALTILHLAGPSVPGSSLVYLYSSVAPTRFPTPFTVAQGTNNSASWNLGQNWFLNLTTYNLVTPDNITISIVTTTELLYRTTLPGSSPNVPPTFTAVGTIPAVPTVGQSFQVYAQIPDPNLLSYSVYVNLSLIPGIPGSGLNKMTYSPTLGAYTYTVPAGVTTGAGSFYVFVNGTDASGLRNSVAFGVTLTSPSSTLVATLLANNSVPVVNSSVTLTDFVSNEGSSAVTATISFSANGASIGSASGTIASGATNAFTQTWTPNAWKTYLLSAVATIPGGVVVGATLNLTVFPLVLVISHNVPAGVRTANNESAYLQQELTSAGIPYTSMFVACSAGLPSSATLNAYDTVVIDFGSTWIGGCPKFPSTTEQAKLTGASAVSFLVLGANAFGATACSSYSAAYLTLFAIKGTVGTCLTLPNATAAATYTGTPASGLRSDGIPASFQFNKTLGSSSSFVPYDYFSQGTTNPAFLKAGANAVGSFKSSGYHQAAIAADPALLATLPNGNTWGTGAAGSSVLYNVMGFLFGFSTSTTSGRALSDFAIAQTSVVGQSHSKVTTVYVALRDNGPTAALITGTLYVNGSAAIYQGLLVSASVTVPAVGGVAWLTLSWLAPATGPFTLSVVLVSPAVQDLYAANDQMPISVLNQPTTFV